MASQGLEQDATTLSGGVCGHSERVSTTNANEAAGFVDDAEADGADGVQQMGASTLSREAFRFSDGVELKAATQVVCEHVQLLPGAIGGIAFSGHDVESELAAQFGEGFLLAASPSSEVPKALDGERFVGGDG